MAMAKQIFDYLPGVWRLIRQTTTSLDHWQNAGAECIKATGFAAFTHSVDDPNLLIYSEKVIIENSLDRSMNGMEAKQKYKYRYDGTAATLTKYFFDDRLFYQMDFSKQNNDETVNANATSDVMACGEHLCIQDFYEANYLFKNDHNFILKYSIRGPKKCYEIINEYEKCNNANDLNGIHMEKGEII